MNSGTGDQGLPDRVAPFGDLRIDVCYQLPGAFRR